ncbi:MAG: hypothetical protein Q4B70_03815 [Lachnospiraceae bacterium]|nr:hypothetical protein [Lachnospiraceae bacterium]
MNEDEMKKGNKQFCDSPVGKPISVGNALENLRFVRESKNSAKQYGWVYHCTTASALLSILKNREFWLSNLQLVNDKEEGKRIDVPEYEKSYYVGCFTYDSNIPKEHWLEYGSIKDGVLIAIRQEWFFENAMFMSSCNVKCKEKLFKVFENYNAALQHIILMQNKGYIVNPFYIRNFGFYKVVYDDKLKKDIEGEAFIEMDGMQISGRTLTPSVAGIIKSKQGVCRRNGQESYEKDWTTEKEIRLKIEIQQFDNTLNGYEIHDQLIIKDVYPPKIAVKVTEEAFKNIILRFSPEFQDKDDFLEKVKKLMPKSKIEVLPSDTF